MNPLIVNIAVIAALLQRASMICGQRCLADIAVVRGWSSSSLMAARRELPPGVDMNERASIARRADDVWSESVVVQIGRVPQVRAWHAVVAASMAWESPGMEPPPPAHLATASMIVWTATRADEVVGLAMLPIAAVSDRAQVHVHPSSATGW
ncbi:hypothetical protein ACGFNU_27285 [Spirillospora sp. NPDC048911]|uniref:hypothetical protein n=1 Tax=Spirillospora sp. NPDC048911 TaxID=3364527 RepID=UPI00371AB6D4